MSYLVVFIGITAALTIGAIGVVAALRFAGFVTDYFSPPTTVYVRSVSWDGTDQAADAQMLRDRFVRWSKNLDASDHQGLEVLFAADHLDRAKEIADLEVEVAGIQLGKLVTLLQTMVPSPYYTLTASGETRNSTHQLTFSLSRAGEIEQQWYLEQHFPDETAKDAAKNQVLDRGVFRVIFDRSRAMQPVPSRFPNERALSAFMRGTQSLNAYLESRRQADLTSAIEGLRELRWEMPTFDEGLDLLALALAEDRKELEAIEIYDFLLGSHNPVAPATLIAAKDAPAKHRLLQLELNRAQAHLFRYEPASAAQSAAHLERVLELIADTQVFPTPAAPAGAAPPRDPKLESLRAYALAQLSDVYGHLLSIVDPDMSDVAPVLDMPRLRPPKPAATDRPGFLSSVQNAHQDLLQEAQQAENAAASYWSKSAREKQTLDRLIASSRGYTKTLEAAWSAPDENKLREEIAIGIRELRRAEAAEPNQYTVLQNLATAYSEPYFDVGGELIFTAIELYKRSLELKKNDYWGYFRLAKIYGRQLALGWEAADTLAELKTNIEEARKLRPSDEGIRALELRVKMWQWAASESQPAQTQAAEIDTVLAMHTGNDWIWPRAVWGVDKLRRFTAKTPDANATPPILPEDQQFAAEQAKLAAEVTTALAELRKSAGVQHWELRYLITSLEALQKDVRAAQYATRDAIPTRF